MGICVVKAGLLSTVQDLGRYGWQSSGVPVGGAMDQRAAMLANATVDNELGEAVLEMTVKGPELLFEQDAVAAIAGADMSPLLDGKPVPRLKPFAVSKGSRLVFRAAIKGVRCYLAIKGGITVPSVLGSKSTLLSSAIGGLNGKALKNGDTLPLGQARTFEPVRWSLSPRFERYLEEDTPLRFVRGRQFDWLTQEAIGIFTDSSYTVSPNSDRMGCRLQGPSLSFAQKRQLPTEGTAFGSIQIPPDGQPIVLMADRQPTGGYPKIGEIILADLPKLSQTAPGNTVRFEEIPLRDAQRLLSEHLRELKTVKAAVSLKWREEEMWDNG